MLTACVSVKWSKIIPVCGIIVVKWKITANFGGDFSIMVDPTGIEPATSRLRIWRSPSWATGPYYRFLPVFQNKKRIFEVLSFREFQRNFFPKYWASRRWSMCVHIDANRTLSQLSYRPSCKTLVYYKRFLGGRQGKTTVARQFFPKPSSNRKISIILVIEALGQIT